MSASRALPYSLLYCCFTAALLLLYCCFPTHTYIHITVCIYQIYERLEGPPILLIDCCFTAALLLRLAALLAPLLLLYCCIAAALLLLFCCITAALLAPLKPTPIRHRQVRTKRNSGQLLNPSPETPPLCSRKAAVKQK